MLSNKEIEQDIFGLAEQFKSCMGRKDYAKAKDCYDTARTVALFVRLDEGKLLELFGSRQQAPPVEGLFPEWAVQKAYYECAVKRKQEEVRVAEDAEGRQRRRREIQLAARGH